jgi:hypothetical protein
MDETFTACISASSTAMPTRLIDGRASDAPACRPVLAERLTSNAPTPVAVTPGATRSRDQSHLPKAGVVAGTVTDVGTHLRLARVVGVCVGSASWSDSTTRLVGCMQR